MTVGATESVSLDDDDDDWREDDDDEEDDDCSSRAAWEPADDDDVGTIIQLEYWTARDRGTVCT